MYFVHEYFSYKSLVLAFFPQIPSPMSTNVHEVVHISSTCTDLESMTDAPQTVAPATLAPRTFSFATLAPPAFFFTVLDQSFE